MRLGLRIVVFALCAVAGGFAGLVVHEVLGHAVPAWFFGARELTLQLNPDFTGSVHYGVDPIAGWRAVVVDSGGIAVNLVTGFGALVIVSRFSKRPMLQRLLILFGGISVYKALEYLAMSFFYGGTGDPLEHASWCTVWHSKGYWLPPLLALPFAIFPFARALAKVEGVPLARLVAIAGPTLILGGTFYYRAALPTAGTAGRTARDRAKAAYCHLDPKDVSVPFPLLPFVVGAATAGALLGAANGRPTSFDARA